jgi:hypothetical protein
MRNYKYGYKKCLAIVLTKGEEISSDSKFYSTRINVENRIWGISSFLPTNYNGTNVSGYILGRWSHIYPRNFSYRTCVFLIWPKITLSRSLKRSLQEFETIILWLFLECVKCVQISWEPLNPARVWVHNRFAVIIRINLYLKTL